MTIILGKMIQFVFPESHNVKGICSWSVMPPVFQVHGVKKSMTLNLTTYQITSAYLGAFVWWYHITTVTI